MNTTAYLVAHFRVTKKGKLKFLGTGVYSESARSLTCAISSKRFACDVAETRGDTFEDALRVMRETMADEHWRMAFGWAANALAENRRP